MDELIEEHQPLKQIFKTMNSYVESACSELRSSDASPASSKIIKPKEIKDVILDLETLLKECSNDARDEIKHYYTQKYFNLGFDDANISAKDKLNMIFYNLEDLDPRHTYVKFKGEVCRVEQVVLEGSMSRGKSFNLVEVAGEMTIDWEKKRHKIGFNNLLKSVKFLNDTEVEEAMADPHDDPIFDRVSLPAGSRRSTSSESESTSSYESVSDEEVVDLDMAIKRDTEKKDDENLNYDEREL